MRKGVLIAGLALLFGVIILASTLVQAEEEVKVPFSAIKPSCYGEIDMSKAEFALSQVGKKCVTESWLEENLSEEEKKQPKDEKTSKETKNKIIVPKTAVKGNKLAQLPESRISQIEVEVPINWVREEWLKEHQQEWKISIKISDIYYTGRTRVWFPIPPSYSLQQISEVEFRPSPDKIVSLSNDNEAAYWRERIDRADTFTQSFRLKIIKRYWQIDYREVSEQNEYSEEIEAFLEPTKGIQADHPEIINKAEEITGGMTNPYLKAKKIAGWVFNAGISGSRPNDDALNALRTRRGQCGAHAFLFAALSKAAGVPTRTVNGIAELSPGRSNTVTGGPRGQNGYHIWNEVYIPPYGWIPVDATRKQIGFYRGDRIVLSQGSGIKLKPFGSKTTWFHIPIAQQHQDWQQIGGGGFRMEVTRLSDE